MAELEEKAKQLALDINEMHMAVGPLRPQISEDAPEPEAEPKDEPVDDENFTGTLNPFEVFPDLIWLKISSKIQDKHDWLNLYFASPKLMDFLQNEMIERIFPQVFTHLRKYLKRKDVINMCAADRKFESAILSWVQTRWLAPRWAGEIYADPNYYEYLANKIPAYSPIVSVKSLEQVQLITNELLEGDSESLIPFGIIFRERWDGVQFWESVKSFLQLFGNRIWFCKIRYKRYVPDIIQCLKLLPNVIRLGLNIPYLTPPAHPPTFPHLAKLKVLSLVQESHTSFMDFLRLHANQLEYLSIVGKHAVEESFQYSKLKKLRLTDFLMRRVPLKLDLFSQAILTKINADIIAFGFAHFGRTFLKFNYFGTSLEDLELQGEVISNDFRNREENDMSWAVNINLPKLKKLTIWSYGVGEHLVLRMHSFQDTHFPFPNYERLFFRSEREKIKQIFDSDIWFILPNLQVVKFCNWSTEGGTYGLYTRDEYNEYLEKPPN